MMATMMSLEDPEVRAQVEAALAKAFTAEPKQDCDDWSAEEMEQLRRFLAQLRIQGGAWYVTKRGRLRRRTLGGRVVCPLTSVHYEALMSCRPHVSARPFALGLYKGAARCQGMSSMDLATAIATAADKPSEAPWVPDPDGGPAVLVSLRALLEAATKVAR